MLSEGFDKKVRDAADHHHPAYDEQAWTKMEKLLNKYLPQKEKDRRMIFFLLLFLLLGGGTWFFISRSTNGQKKELAVGTRPSDKNAGSVEKEITTGTTVIPEEKNDNATIDPAKGSQAPDNKDNINGTNLLMNNNSVTIIKDRQTQNITKRNKGKTEPVVLTPIDKNQVADDKAPVTVKDPGKVEKDELLMNKNATDIIGIDKKDKAPAVAINNTKPAEPVKKESEPLVKTPDAKKNKPARNNKASYLFFSASGGPDVSMVGIGSMGKMKWLGGVGLGYTYKEKFTLRTGFYEARKIYTATAEDYHAPAGFYAYYPQLEKVEADCKVFEIPIALSYNFGRTPKQNWFASTGLSTYLMKRETYRFYYKNAVTGAAVNRQRTIYNSNDHYFSVLTLSGGYQRKLNKTFSIVAEPYLKIPVMGIGFGKVKLNSGGVLFTITARPF